MAYIADKLYGEHISLGVDADSDCYDITVSGNFFMNFAPGKQTTGPVYGIRDNDGTMEFKNKGGAWSGLT